MRLDQAGLIDPATVAERIEMIEAHTLVVERLRNRIGMYRPGS